MDIRKGTTWISSFVMGSIMAETEAKLGTQQIPEVSESLFSSIDIILLALIVGGISWYLVNKHKKTTTVSNGRSYSIQ
ncbi:hypothetical protein JTB14_030279 [Gonioctena quinquepunctata]|nr:hypothetical protein JTB14_030279 [Gonioctena quinquepunctata]